MTSRASSHTFDEIDRLLAYDPQSGVLTWKNPPKNSPRKAGDVAGTISSGGYRAICVGGSTVLEHRLAWLLMTGAWPKHTVDHRNRIASDNRWENLREATRAEQCHNRSSKRVSKSGHRGVYWRPGRNRWVASIMAHGRTRRIHCATLDEAVAARALLTHQFHGEFALGRKAPAVAS